MPTISIIVPVYNQQPYLTECLNSIVTQSFSDFEVVLVDDGSTDSSLSICAEYESKYDNVRVVKKLNGGVSSARNLGLKKSVGDLICFVDADDILMPGALSVMERGMENTSIDLFVGGYIVKNENGHVVYSLPDIYTEILSREQGIEQMYHPHPYRYQGYIWNKMFRRSVIERNHILFDEAISYNEDRLFVTQYISAQPGGILLDSTPVYSYYEHKEGAMASLQEGFNPKFVTDFEAMIKMQKVIRRTFHDRKLTTMAQDGTMDSYARIHYMMDASGVTQKEIHNKMKIRLLFSSPIFLFHLLRTHFGGSPFSSTH